jgi:predicted neuraminidase
MMKNIFLYLSMVAALIDTNSGLAQKPWKKGILTDEFIFETAAFPECHAATIAETPLGLVVAWFGGTKERNPDVEIWMSRREGEHWSVPISIANGIVNDTLRYACWNPVLFQIPDGKLLLFYKTGPNVARWKGWMKSSSDHGKTWSQPKALPEGLLGPVKNKPVVLSNGVILSASSTEGDGWKIHFEASADSGKTWEKIGPINDGRTINAIQPSILLHKDGQLQLLARSKNRALVQAWSPDNGKTWTPLSFTDLPNNNSGTDAVTLKNGRHILVYNHVLPPDTARNGKGARTPLNLAYSKNGKTWYAALVLEDSPISQYSYPSVIQGTDGMIHIVYTWRRQRIKYVKIDPSKLKGKKIINGNWPFLKGYRLPTVGDLTND